MTSRRQRVLDRWADTTYDVLVVGGGVTGAGVARDAALRGLRVALVDRGDFASGTSSKSGKLIHGGLRYLKHRHLGLVFEACRERWRLWKIVAPHLVRPVRFVVPFYRFSRTPRWLLAAGLVLYELLALGRTGGRFRLLSRRRLAELEPELLTDDCQGGLEYGDCAALDFRLVIDTLKSAELAGADLLNYAEVLSATHQGSAWRVAVTDRRQGTEHLVRARAVVNATGPWADDVQTRLAAPEQFGLKTTSGVHLVLRRDRLPVGHTLALETADARMIYVVPWDERLLVGTTDRFFSGDLEQATPEAADQQYLLDTLNRYFPRARLVADDVCQAIVGMRPLMGSDEGVREDDLPRDYQILIDRRGAVSITGGKLTTHRAMAQRVVDLLVRRFFNDRTLRRCATVAPISGGSLALPRDASPRLRALWARYGDNALHIEQLIEQSPDLAQPLAPGVPVLRAEVNYAVAHEYVETLADLVDRRWGLFLDPPVADWHPQAAAWLAGLQPVDPLRHQPLEETA